MLFICSLLAFSMNAVEANKKKKKQKPPVNQLNPNQLNQLKRERNNAK